MLLYFESEQFVAPDPKNASLRSRVFDAAQAHKIKSNPKQVFALVSTTLRYQQFIREIIKNSKLLKDRKQRSFPKKLTPNLAVLLVHDLLFTKAGRIQSAKHPVKDFILGNKTRLSSEYVKLKLRLKVKDFGELVEEEDSGDDYTPIRWFRVNTIKATVESVMGKDPFFKRLAKIGSLDELKANGTKEQKEAALGKIYHDEYIPNLFGISPKEKITNSKAYKEGKIIIQDRSSCFPAHILSPAPGDKVIDSCSAPGNKTTHAASYVRNTKRSIVAFEKNQNRAKVLQKMVDRAGASKCVTVKNADFTTTNPKDYPDVVGFIVDPSCSGSGIFGREQEDQRNARNERGQENGKENSQENGNNKSKNNDEAVELDEQMLDENPVDTTEDDIVAALIKSKNHDPERLAKLSSFQFTIVKHALQFPGARKLVYSTCSIHPEENEQVVIDLLNDEKIQKLGWKLCDRKDVIPAWPRRGWKDEFVKARFTEEEAAKFADGCIRSLPKIDGGIGFFAAAFERDV